MLVRAPKIEKVKSLKCGGVVGRENGKNDQTNPQGAEPSRVGIDGMELAEKKVDGMVKIKNESVIDGEVRSPNNEGGHNGWLAAGKIGRKCGPFDMIDCDGNKEGTVPSELEKNGMFKQSKMEKWSGGKQKMV